MGRRRRLVGSMVLVTALGVAAGCTGSTQAEPDPTETPTATGTPSPDPVELDLAVYGSAPVVRVYRDIANAFTADHPEVTVDLTTYPDALTAETAVAEELQSGEGPDVFLLDQFSLPSYVEGGLLQPLDVLMEDRGLAFGDDFQRTALTAFSAESGLQCMPTEISPYVVYYNRDLVPVNQLLAQGVTVPTGDQSWEWTEFVLTAQAAAAQQPVGAVKGGYVPADLELLTAFIRSAGGDVVDSALAPSSLTLTADDTVETLRQIAVFGHDRRVSLTPREIVASDPLTRFREGRLAMYIGTRADLPTLSKTDGLSFDVLPLPSFGKMRATSEIRGLCLSADTDEREAAADLIAYAVGEEASELAAGSAAMVPARLDALASDAFRFTGSADRNDTPFVTGVRKSEPMPYSAAWNDVSAVADGVLTRVFLDPEFDLDARLVERLERLNRRSSNIFATEDLAAE